MVVTALEQKKDVEKIYNALSGSVYKYVKQCIENKQIKSISELENDWKFLLSKYQNDINELKQELAKRSSLKKNKIKYPIDSISEITKYYLNIRYPNNIVNHLTNMFSTDNWIDFENRYYIFASSIVNINKDILQQDIKTVNNIIMKQFKNNKNQFTKYLGQLKYKIQNFDNNFGRYRLKYYEQPLFMSKLQEYISNIKEISDITKYCDSNGNDIVKYVKTESEFFESELDYVLYYIKTGNDWAMQYVTQYVRDCIVHINNNDNNIYRNYNDELGNILNTINNSNYKSKYKNIIKLSNNYRNTISVYQNNKNKKMKEIASQSNDILKAIYERGNAIKETKNNDEFIDAVSKFTRALERQINSLIENNTIYDQNELSSNLITNVWKLCETNNIINTIITRLRKYSKNNNDAFEELYEVLSNESFSNSEPFIKFKKIVN